jgi:hypothetical protein
VTPEVGDLVTVLPHRQFATRLMMGRWHGRVRDLCLVHTDWVWVQQVRRDGDAWRPGMTTQARIDHLVPIEVDIDLFGNPVGAR